MNPTPQSLYRVGAPALEARLGEGDPDAPPREFVGAARFFRETNGRNPYPEEILQAEVVSALVGRRTGPRPMPELTVTDWRSMVAADLTWGGMTNEEAARSAWAIPPRDLEEIIAKYRGLAHGAAAGVAIQSAIRTLMTAAVSTSPDAPVIAARLALVVLGAFAAPAAAAVGASPAEMPTDGGPGRAEPEDAGE